MPPETLEKVANQENQTESVNEKLGVLFADATAYFYFCHMPQESYQKIHDFVSIAFADNSSETALVIAANLFQEKFRLNSQENTQRRLFSPNFRPSNGYPRLEPNPDKVMSNILENGREVLQDEEKFNNFYSWYSQIEADLET